MFFFPRKYGSQVSVAIAMVLQYIKNRAVFCMCDYFCKLLSISNNNSIQLFSGGKTYLCLKITTFHKSLPSKFNP